MTLNCLRNNIIEIYRREQLICFFTIIIQTIFNNPMKHFELYFEFTNKERRIRRNLIFQFSSIDYKMIILLNLSNFWNYFHQTQFFFFGQTRNPKSISLQGKLTTSLHTLASIFMLTPFYCQIAIKGFVGFKFKLHRIGLVSVYKTCNSTYL